MVDTGENPEVPFPRDMIDLEVIRDGPSSVLKIQTHETETTTVFLHVSEFMCETEN